jgi:hypothetical protein
VKKIIIVLCILAAVIGVTAFFNADGLAEKKEMQKNALLTIKVDGKEVKTINMEFIKELGEVEFNANLKKNGKAPIEKTYIGVPLIKVLEACDVDMEGKTQVIAKAVDGYNSALNADEVLDEENIYVAYKEDGEFLGTKEDGGSGPYKVIISKDKFSQRWCKFLTEVEVK